MSDSSISSFVVDRFAGARLRENNGVVVFHREPVKEDETCIVAVDTVENAFLREVRSNEDERENTERGLELNLEMYGYCFMPNGAMLKNPDSCWNCAGRICTSFDSSMERISVSARG